MVEEQMVGLRHRSSRKKKQLTVIQSGERHNPTILSNLLHDTSSPVLALLAEQFGLRRVPGLSQEALIARILKHLSDEELDALCDEMVAAHFGSLSFDRLLDMALEGGPKRPARQGKPRLDQISKHEATLIQSGPPRWAYTMRGHDQVIDLDQRILVCDCPFFAFASRRQVLCKHLAIAFKLIPEVYAREALIDLLVLRRYGGRQAGRWSFDSDRAA